MAHPQARFGLLAVLISIALTSCTAEQAAPSPTVEASTTAVPTSVDVETSLVSAGEVCDTARSLWALTGGPDPAEEAERATDLVDQANRGDDLELAKSIGVFGSWLRDRAVAPSGTDLVEIMPPTLVENVASINRICEAAGRPTDLPEDQALLLFSCPDEFCGFPEDFELLPTTTVDAAPPATVAPDTTTSLAAGPAGTQFETIDDLFQRFADLWIAQDWDAMAIIATPAVVSEARLWSPSDVSILNEGVSCTPGRLGTGICQLLVYPAEPPALVFAISYEIQEATGDRITELRFDGDAG